MPSGPTIVNVQNTESNARVWGIQELSKNGLIGFELGNIVPGVFTPVLAKHSKSFSLIECVSVGVD